MQRPLFFAQKSESAQNKIQRAQSVCRLPVAIRQSTVKAKARAQGHGLKGDVPPHFLGKPRGVPLPLPRGVCSQEE